MRIKQLYEITGYFPIESEHYHGKIKSPEIDELENKFQSFEITEEEYYVEIERLDFKFKDENPEIYPKMGFLI